MPDTSLRERQGLANLEEKMIHVSTLRCYAADRTEALRGRCSVVFDLGNGRPESWIAVAQEGKSMPCSQKPTTNCRLLPPGRAINAVI